MYQNKKIGVFASHVFGNYQYRVCDGIVSTAAEYGFRVEVYASLLDGEGLGDYAAGEFGILSIPHFSELDGIIFLSGTYLSSALRDGIYDLLEKHPETPVVEITNSACKYPQILFENNTMTGDLTTHMLEDHGAKRLCFLGCALERQFSDVREQAFRDALTEHGLTPDDRDIVLCNYDYNAIREALRQFTAESMPDGIICYNDRMALLLMEAAQELGYRIPDDFAVTGCDDLTDAAEVNPPLTTVTFPVEDLGRSAVEMLRALLHDQTKTAETVYAKPLIRCSCGCREDASPASYRLLGRKNRMIGSLHQSILSITNLSFALQSVDDIDDACDLIADYLQTHSVCQEFYLCLYADWDQLSDHVDHILRLTDGADDMPVSDTVLLKLGVRDGKRLPSGDFQRTSLLPAHVMKDGTTCYAATPLYFGAKVFGYLVTVYAPEHSAFYFHSLQLLMQISGVLRTILEKKRTGQLVRRLEHIYLRDPLTDLLNKYGFEQSQQALLIDAKELSSPLCCFIVDVQNLRAIIESFGHRDSDFALQVVATAIKHAQKPEDIAARFSGDEFYVLGMDYTEEDAEEFIKDVSSYLKNYNALSTKQFEITCRISHSIFSADQLSDTVTIYDMFAAADRNT